MKQNAVMTLLTNFAQQTELSTVLSLALVVQRAAVSLHFCKAKRSQAMAVVLMYKLTYKHSWTLLWRILNYHDTMGGQLKCPFLLAKCNKECIALAGLVMVYISCCEKAQCLHLNFLLFKTGIFVVCYKVEVYCETAWCGIVNFLILTVFTFPCKFLPAKKSEKFWVTITRN